MLTFKVGLYHKPAYLAELVIDHTPSRSLRSSVKELLVEPKDKDKDRVAEPSDLRHLTIYQSTSVLSPPSTVFATS